jgi:DNA modification methylase
MSELLSEQERKQIAEAILSGSKVSPKYAASLIESTQEMELIWSGKSDVAEQVVLPFQSIEQIDEPRLDMSIAQTLFDFDFNSGRQSGGWTNKLIWGDNRLILSSLTRGPMRQSIEKAGGLKLVYIDPPFDVGYDFSMDVAVGDEAVNKEPSVLEQFAYRDTWGKGIDSYASMLHSRLREIHDLLAENGSLLLHCDYRTSGVTRMILDEIFGRDRLVNEIIWTYATGGASKEFLARKHDTIFWYTKTETYQYFPERIPEKRTEKSLKRAQNPNGARITSDNEYKLPTDVWNVQALNPMSNERTGYPTQKPEELLERAILAFTEPGDLVADFFCGSGTTLSVAEKLGRKWIGADLGRFAVHTSRKRLISVQRELKELGKAYRSFEILNLGGYERQHYLGNVSGESDVEGLKAHKRKAFVELVLSAYGAQASNQLPPFSGSKHLTAVFVGEVDRAVTQADVEECIEAAISSGITKIDILGFEFEMGISPLLSDRAKEQGLTLTLRYIPSDVFDSRAVKSGDVQFYEVGYLEVKPEVKGLNLRINLSDFGVFYRQTDADEAALSLRPGGSKIVVDQGQVLRLAKTKTGTITRENVTSKWEDWIDYWSIDFNFESRPEIIRVLQDGAETELATGRYIFENEWQSFRTMKDRNLELWSAPHTYDGPGTYAVAVKVIDIFGNDTTRVFKVKVG